MSDLELILTAITVSLLAYRPSEGGEFVFDDLLILEHVRALAKTGGNVGLTDLWNLCRKTSRGLLWWTYKRDAAAHEYSPVGWHATNLAIHAINIALVYASLRYWLDPIPATSGALVFGLTPLATQTVSPISGRSSALCMVFCLTTLVLLQIGTWWPIPIVLWYGLKTKEEIVAWPLTLAAVWWWGL